MSNPANQANNPVNNLNPNPNPNPNPPNPPNPLTVTTRETVARMAVTPRRGGLDTISGVDIEWTGGNPYDANVVAPTANGCYRPIDPDKARKVEDKCVQPLPEDRKLQVIYTTLTKKQAPLKQWMKDVSAHLKSNGMDSVFFAVKSNRAVDLLNNWYQMDMNEVTEWYKQEQWDNYDIDNLRMSGKFL